ncbi:HlyD family type I secretion periplasmic adaptor subunit [Rhodoferax sp. U2-2l]|uniref:HlyD family type I secretion periplasmic adaptor subunit n=1 Tax=Rhodoferax sp. U2-2l TaxID=2884000 RepID=UPI001D09F02D|nr:HlyD family type I secretion periplasmic adaptor subunit [Rhodoferax sp. U2-2l]MCB8747969.1 HlyD family type I secretion periplasmic adaptor subunit [Rhodoferax sp. U2-2l]
MAFFSKKAFERSGEAIHRATKASETTFGTLVKRFTPIDVKDNLDWAGDADWARLQQEPLRARKLLHIAGVALLVMIVWAAFASIDEITRGEARVVPTSQVQIIQSVDGGVVETLAVKEGQIVEAGQLLLRVDPTRFVSTMLESRAGQLSLQAKVLRLEALTRGTPFNPPEELRKEAPDVVAQETSLYESRKAEINAQISIYQSQLAQRQQELNEVRARLDQAVRKLELKTREINATRPMVASGAVSEVEILRLESEIASLRGDREQSTAQLSRVQSSISEASRKIEEVQLTSRNAMSSELSDTMSKLASLTQGGRALEDKVKHADIKSPVRGTVKRLLVNTVGAVVQPGKEVVEVVPLDDALILEVQIAPKDIGFLRPGQAAMVKFSAYDFSIYGGLDAEVFLIGADSVLDEKGNAFYHVRVKTNQPSLGANLPIIPGMVAQVDIMTGKKSVLSYLLKPVLRAKANALTER